MVARGETPPNVRTDIDDRAPDPARPLSAPTQAPLPKPWEAKGRAAAAGIAGTAPSVEHGGELPASSALPITAAGPYSPPAAHSQAFGSYIAADALGGPFDDVAAASATPGAAGAAAEGAGGDFLLGNGVAIPPASPSWRPPLPPPFSVAPAASASHKKAAVADGAPAAGAPAAPSPAAALPAETDAEPELPGHSTAAGGAAGAGALAVAAAAAAGGGAARDSSGASGSAGQAMGPEATAIAAQ